MLLHGATCDKIAGSDFDLRGVCADPKGGRVEGWVAPKGERQDSYFLGGFGNYEFCNTLYVVGLLV